MIKTSNNIERDFYTFVRQSALGRAVNDKVYRSGMRPKDDKTEAIIVKSLTGDAEQVQEGIVIINAYVPNLKGDFRDLPNKARIGELEELMMQFVESAGGTEYDLHLSELPTTIEATEVKQSCITARVKYKRIIY